MHRVIYPLNGSQVAKLKIGNALFICNRKTRRRRKEKQNKIKNKNKQTNKQKQSKRKTNKQTKNFKHWVYSSFE